MYSHDEEINRQINLLKLAFDIRIRPIEARARLAISLLIAVAGVGLGYSLSATSFDLNADVIFGALLLLLCYAYFRDTRLTSDLAWRLSEHLIRLSRGEMLPDFQAAMREMLAGRPRWMKFRL